MTTIYLDVLFLLNFFITWLLLMATVKLMNAPKKRWRLLCGSLLGGVFSLLILFPVSGWALCMIRLSMGVLLVMLVFWERGKGRQTAKAGFCFFVVNFLFAGVMLALWNFFPMAGMQYKNGVVYFNFSALTLALSTAAAYLALSVFTAIWNKRSRKEELIFIRLALGGRETEICCLADTGNKLCDLFSGLPVIVCEYGAVEELLPIRLRTFFSGGADTALIGAEEEGRRIRLRMIPVSGAGGQGSLPAFLPERLTVGENECRAMVAVTEQRLSDGSFRGILNTALLKE